MLRRYGVLLLGAFAALICVRLGVWQVRRLGQRGALRALVETREGLPPLDLAGVPAGTWAGAGADSLAYRPVSVRGRFDFARQVVVIARVVDEVPAVYVTTPLRFGDRTVLVERGWVPSPDAYTVALDSVGEPDTATVTGVLVPVAGGRDVAPDSTVWPLRARWDDPRALGARFPYPLLPLVLRRTTATKPRAGLRPIAAPSLDNGPHLSYAIQWFSFAVIALVGSLILFRKERRDPLY